MMDSKTKKKGYIWFSLTGILATLFTYACNKLTTEGNLVWNFSWILKWIGISIVLGILLGGLLFFLCTMWKEKVSDCTKVPAYLTAPCSGRKTFFLSFAIMVLCWLPAWLAYYPGICSYDIPAQMKQVLTGEYNTHHPLAHTLLLQFFFKIGVALGNENLGISLYALIQLLVLAASMAGIIAIMAKWQAKRLSIIVLTIYCALLPVNAYMSITTTKDVLFTVFVIWFFAGLYTYLTKEEKLIKSLRIPYILVIVGVVLFRNNGKYALAVTWGVLGIVFLWNLVKKQNVRKWGVVFVDTTIGLLFGCIIASGLAKGLDAQPGDKREMLSMPIQQLARTMVYHGGAGVMAEDDNTVEQQYKDLLNEFFLYEGYKNYRPEISDPVKRTTNTYVVRYRTGEFVKTYLGLLAKYPGDYVNAALAINTGWFSLTDKSHAIINQYDVHDGYGYIQTNWSQELGGTNLSRDSKWPWLLEKLDTFASENAYIKIPVVRFLVAPGIYLWCYLFMAIWLLLHKRYTDLLPFTWILGYFGTLILGPTVQMRYLYPLMVVLPFMLLYVGKRTAKGNQTVSSIGEEQ